MVRRWAVPIASFLALLLAGVALGMSLRHKDWLEWCYAQGGYAWSPGANAAAFSILNEEPVKAGDVYYCLTPDENGNKILGTKEMS